MQRTLANCLDSILSQSLNKIEIICIDDGSTDNSRDILKNYAEKYRQIKVIRQANKGSGAARNAGIFAANGEFLAFADSDDHYCNNNALEILYNSAVNQGAEICGGKLINAENSEVYLFEKKYNCVLFQNTFIDYSSYQEEWGYQAFIFNADFIKSNQLYFPEYRRYQDPPWFVRSMNKAGRFFSADVNVYVYRGGGAHIKWNEQKCYDYLCGICDVIKYAAENNLNTLTEIRYRRLLYIPKILPKTGLNKRLKSKIDEILSLIDVKCLDENITQHYVNWSDLYGIAAIRKTGFFVNLKDFYIFGEWRD